MSNFLARHKLLIVGLAILALGIALAAKRGKNGSNENG